MDTLLIVLFIAILTAIALIISRPIVRMSQNTQDIRDSYQLQYQAVLDQIKIMERLSNAVGEPDDILEQIEEKRALAAELINLINIETAHRREDVYTDLLNQEGNSSDQDPGMGRMYCPQCGGTITAGDKFCTHCGHRLQP